MDNSGQIPIGRYRVNGKNSLYRKNSPGPAAGKPSLSAREQGRTEGAASIKRLPAFPFSRFSCFSWTKRILNREKREIRESFDP